jgi:hypothetical protein
MPNRNTHCAISKQRTGFSFEELHKWIDEPQEYLDSLIESNDIIIHKAIRTT